MLLVTAVKGVKSGVSAEAIEHRRGRRVHLVHRRQAEHEFHGAQQTGLVVLRVDHRAALGVSADDVGGRAVAAHMVPTILGVVLNRKNTRVRPKPAVADGFDHLAEREIVVRHLGGGRGRPGFGSAGVVVRQPDDDEVRKIVRRFEVLSICR